MHQIRPGVWVDDPWPGAHQAQTHIDHRGIVHVTGERLNDRVAFINGQRFVPAQVDRSAEMELEPPTSCEKDR